MTFVEVLSCDVATRQTIRRYYAIDGSLRTLEVWDGSRWRDPLDLLSRVKLTAGRL